MKKFLIETFWCLMYIIFLDLFAHDLIVQGRWDIWSWATVYMCIASVSVLNVGYWIDRK